MPHFDGNCRGESRQNRVKIETRIWVARIVVAALIISKSQNARSRSVTGVWGAGHGPATSILRQKSAPPESASLLPPENLHFR
jgi:hypothetical protein